MALRLLAFIFAVAVVDGSKVDVTPIEKVTELLKGLQAKITKEGEKEAAAYDKFACFCKEQATEKQLSIEKSTKKITNLGAKIRLGTATQTSLNGKVSDLTASISKREAEMKKDAAARAAAHKKYLAQATDIAESISSTAGAIQSFKEAKGDLKNSKINLLQVHDKLLASASRIFSTPDSISLIQEADSEEYEQAPKYQFQGNGIIASLEELLANFKKMKATVDMDEVDKKSVFDKKALGDSNENKFAGEERDEKSKLEATEQENVMGLTNDKDEETKDKIADQAFLKTLTADCENKAKVFDQRSKTRTDELTAMTGAIAELEGGVKKNEGANSQLVGLVQGDLAPSFIQRLTLQEKGDRAVRRVQELLQQAASDQDSSVLKNAAVRVMLAKDHFVKVRGLITDLIKKLKSEAKDEATQKSLCDKNMGKAMADRDKGYARKEAAATKVATLQAKQQDLTDAISELGSQISENNKALNEATELRNEEKSANTEAIEGATEGKVAVDRALSLLSSFYSKAAKASFVQLRSQKYTPPNADRDGKSIDDLSPDTEATNYKGAQEESKGIMGMLEVISSDFDRTIKTVTKDEKTAAAEFAAFKKSTERDTATKMKTEKTKKAELSDAEVDENDQESLHKDATELLSGSEESLENLKAQCVDGEETYEERVAARKKEIESLKDAMEVLDGMQS